MSETTTIYARESWYGDSRDGLFEEGHGYHYFAIIDGQKIIEGYEYYEADDGEEVVTPLPEMKNVKWIDDLGFESLEPLEIIAKDLFDDIKSLCSKKRKK